MVMEKQKKISRIQMCDLQAWKNNVISVILSLNNNLIIGTIFQSDRNEKIFVLVFLLNLEIAHFKCKMQCLYNSILKPPSVIITLHSL